MSSIRITLNRRTYVVFVAAFSLLVITVMMLPAVVAAPPDDVPKAKDPKFHLEEATIAGIHNAIKTKQITCQGLVQAYIDRAAAYNGVCTKLVTADGAPIPPALGVVRAGAPIVFPTETVPISSVLPNFAQYIGTPMDLGRMDTTISDPSVQQQFGMRVGIPDAGQLNALETINIRGERSVTCKGAYDAHPSTGPLPAGAPTGCEAFRQQPDALERAAELDAQYGNKPDLKNLPLYCLPFSFKNWYFAKDMRGTGGQDVNFAMDAPPFDATNIAELRAKGAIVYAVANADEVNLSASGPATSQKIFPSGAHALSAWGGQTCNAYDTAREPRGTSSGSGVSVAANLVVFSICEQGTVSCQGPPIRNNVVNLLTTKGIIADGGIHAQKIHERAGIHARTVGDAVLVLDAIKGYKSGDYFTAIPEALIPEEPYASFVIDDNDLKKNSKPLEGMRIGVVREFMVKHTQNHVAISDQADQEIKTILRDKLGAELVEVVDRLYPDDPGIPNIEYTFQDAIAEILAINAPEYFFQTTSSGALEFAVPGFDVRTMDYMVKLAVGEAPLSDNFYILRLKDRVDNINQRPFSVAKHLLERGDERVTDWASWVANAKFVTDARRAGAENAVSVEDIRATQGIDRIKMQTLARLVVLKVMYENDIDAFVNPAVSHPPRLIGGPSEPSVRGQTALGCCPSFTAVLGIPEIAVPAGYNQIVYEPQFVLSADKTRYLQVTGTVQSLLPVPMPISMMFWAGPGDEPAVIKVASAYESATHHRVPPPDFGPLPGEP